MDAKRNTQPDFVGSENVKKKHALQIEQFEHWATERNWDKFHNSHYDWWTFPIDKPSRLGYAYTVFDEEVEQLKSDPEFMRRYLRGVELLMLSWGWDLYGERMIDNADVDQMWHDWPIRLYKCGQSLKLFGCLDELSSVKKYGQILISEGADFNFRGTDLKTPFLNL